MRRERWQLAGCAAAALLLVAGAAESQTPSEPTTQPTEQQDVGMGIDASMGDQSVTTTQESGSGQSGEGAASPNMGQDDYDDVKKSE